LLAKGHNSLLDLAKVTQTALLVAVALNQVNALALSWHKSVTVDVVSVIHNQMIAPLKLSVQDKLPRPRLLLRRRRTLPPVLLPQQPQQQPHLQEHNSLREPARATRTVLQDVVASILASVPALLWHRSVMVDVVSATLNRTIVPLKLSAPHKLPHHPLPHLHRHQHHHPLP
jgi:hypothetical protein